MVEFGVRAALGGGTVPLPPAPEVPFIIRRSDGKPVRLRHPRVQSLSNNKGLLQSTPRTARPLLQAVTILLILLACVVVPRTARSQAVYGSIFGTITDQSGAAVVGAKLTVTSVQKNTQFETTSNGAGNYSVTHLIPDQYDVRAGASGFKAVESSGIPVYADQAARVDVELQVGAAQEKLTVSAEELPLMKTDRSDVATTFDERAAESLPLFNRNFTSLELLTPGTSKFGWQHVSAENPQGGIQIMVNGQHFSGTSYQLDGTDNRDPVLGIIVINPTLESVTQTKVTTQNYDAEFGQALAGVVTVQTKSGTNDLHGSAFEFRRTGWARRGTPLPSHRTGLCPPQSGTSSAARWAAG